MFDKKHDHHRRKGKMQLDQKEDHNKEAKQTWIENCADIEDCLANSNTKKALQLVKGITKQKNSNVSTIQYKDCNCLTEEKDIMSIWTEFFSEP